MRRFVRLWALLLPAAFFSLPLPAIGQGTEGACHDVSPDDAVARGFAVALRVSTNLPGLRQELSRSENSVAGPGSAEDSDGLASVAVPADGSLARADLLRTSSHGTVQADLGARQVSTAEVLNLSLLDGFVQVTAARARGTALTEDGMADESGNGSSLEETVVGDQRVTQASPNTRIPLPADRFGADSWVLLHERIDEGFFPDSSHTQYRTNVTIRMVHVVVTDLDPSAAGLQAVDIVVSEVFAHAQTPTAFCGGPQGVAGSAYVARLRRDGSTVLPGIVIGHVEIPITGGSSEQTYADIDAPSGEARLTVGAATSSASGSVVLGETSDSDAFARLQDVCVKTQEGGDCLIQAQLVRADSHSRAFRDLGDPGDVDTVSWGSVVVARLVVDGIDVCAELGLQETCTPAKNTVRQIGDYTVFLNERARDLDPEGHTEYTVRAVRIEGPVVGSLTLGRAYTGADYGTRDDT